MNKKEIFERAMKLIYELKNRARELKDMRTEYLADQLQVQVENLVSPD